MTREDGLTRIGVCGIGSIGARHVRAFCSLPDVRVVAFDSVGDTRSRVEDGVDVVDSFPALLDADLDGLVVATPDQHHLAPTAAACERGIPVLLEKPIADNVAAAQQIVEVAHETGTRVLLGYVLRHDRCLLRAKHLLETGAVGTPVSFQVMLGAFETLRLARNRFSQAPPGGLLFDYSHEWDYLRWLIGPVVGGFALTHESGDIEPRQDPNVADAVLRLVTEASGTVTGTVHLDYVQDPPCRRIIVIGDRGTLTVDVTIGTVECRSGVKLTTDRFGFARDDLFRRQAGHFVEVTAGRARPAATATDGMAAFEVGAALWKSALTGAWSSIARGIRTEPKMQTDMRAPVVAQGGPIDD